MTTKITRKTGIIGTVARLTIRVNGEKIAKIANNETLELNLPEEKSYLKVTQAGSKSKEVEIKRGGTYQVTTNSWSKNILLLFILTMVFSHFFQDSLMKTTIVIILLLAVVISCFVFNFFEIKAVETGT